MVGWVSTLDSEGVRILVVALVLMTMCSSLLGVLMGWKLRGREVERLERKVRYLRLELNKVWEGRRKKNERNGGVNGTAG